MKLKEQNMNNKELKGSAKWLGTREYTASFDMKCNIWYETIHFIWNVNISKVFKFWCCHPSLSAFVASELVKEASISWYIFQLFNNGAHINCAIIFKFEQTS